MNREAQLDMREVRRRLSYDPDTGLFHILRRTADMYQDTEKWSAAQLAGSFNKRMAGKVAGASLTLGYIKLKVMGHQVMAHRLAFLFMGCVPPHVVDHINGVPSDNRWCNLRPCETQQQNTTNRKLSVNNSSGFRGILRRTNTKTLRWEVSIKAHAEYHYLGSHICLGRAIAARLMAEREYGFAPRR